MSEFFITVFGVVAHAAQTTIPVPVNPYAIPGNDPVGVIGSAYRLALQFGVLLAFAQIAYAAFRYGLAAGDSGAQKDARDRIWEALLGLVILLSAFLILRTINTSLVDVRVPILNMPPSTGTPGPANTNEADVRSQLGAAQIAINKAPCAAGQTSNCTNVAGLRQTTIDGTIALKNACGCDMIITGGTEGANHQVGQNSHGNGFKVDFGLTPALTAYIESHYAPAGTRSDGATLYKDPAGNTYAKESNHWDVCYGC